MTQVCSMRLKTVVGKFVGKIINNLKKCILCRVLLVVRLVVWESRQPKTIISTKSSTLEVQVLQAIFHTL